MTESDAQAAQEQEEPTSAADPPLSALQDHIAKKGGGYYYAHKPKEGWDDSMKWDGKVNPRLLSKKEGETAEKKLTAAEITKYGWEDAPKRVKIYITLEGVGQLADKQLVLEWTPTSVDLRINDLGGKVYGLSLPLYSTIKGAKLKKKPDSLVLTLSKEDELTWAELKKSSD